MSTLAKPSDDKKYPFESTGKKVAADPIRLDKGNAYKGQLHYTAEFVPAPALRGVKFEGPPNEMQRAAEATAENASASSASSAAEAPDVPTITVSSPIGDEGPKTHAPGKSADTTHTTETSHTAESAETDHTTESAATAQTSKTAEEEHVEAGMEMSREELLQQRTLGLVVL